MAARDGRAVITGSLEQVMVEPLLKLLEDQIQTMNPSLKSLRSGGSVVGCSPTAKAWARVLTSYTADP